MDSIVSCVFRAKRDSAFALKTFAWLMCFLSYGIRMLVFKCCQWIVADCFLVDLVAIRLILFRSILFRSILFLNQSFQVDCNGWDQDIISRISHKWSVN